VDCFENFMKNHASFFDRKWHFIFAPFYISVISTGNFIDLLYWKLFILTVDLNFNFKTCQSWCRVKIHCFENIKCAWLQSRESPRKFRPHRNRLSLRMNRAKWTFSRRASKPVCTFLPFHLPLSIRVSIIFFPACVPDRNKRPWNTLAPELKNYRGQKKNM